MLSAKLVCIFFVFALYLAENGVSCSSSITIFSGSLEEFKEKYQSEDSKFSLVSFSEKGYSLKTCKQLAEKLDGVVEIVAINCKDDAELCAELEINASTYALYPKGDKFTGEIEYPNKIYEFVIASSIVYDVGNMNVFYREFHDTLLHQEPAWLVFYCFKNKDEELNEDLNCLWGKDPTLAKKLSLALNGTIKVGVVDCTLPDHQTFCEVAKPKRSAPIVLYSYFPILQALYSFKDGVTTIDQIRDLIQQDEIQTKEFHEIVKMIPSILDGQEKNDKFFDPRFMKSKDEKEAIKKVEEKAAAAEKSAKEDSARGGVADAETVEVVEDKSNKNIEL